MSSKSIRFEIPDDVFADAVRFFWQQRGIQAGAARAGDGERQSVTGGKHLDGVLTAIVSLLTQHNVSTSEIFTKCSLHNTGKLQLPGFFRATKEWDLLVIREKRLLAALELKAQVGPSFGNNVNNRTEEALGSAEDIWTAYREGAFGDSAQPWLGYFFLLEDHPRSTRPVKNMEPHFGVFDEFDGASYAKRYELLCRKLVLERKYTSACFLMTKRPNPVGYPTASAARKGRRRRALTESHQVHTEPNPDLGARRFLSSFLRSVIPA